MTAFDFEGNDWDEITEREKRAIVDRLVRERDALSDDYETLAAEHDQCGHLGVGTVGTMDDQVDGVAAALDEVDKTLDGLPDTAASGETIDALAAVSKAWNALVASYRAPVAGERGDDANRECATCGDPIYCPSCASEASR